MTQNKRRMNPERREKHRLPRRLRKRSRDEGVGKNGTNALTPTLKRLSVHMVII